jgi:hypothetical protein
MDRLRWFLAFPFIIVGEFCFELASYIIGIDAINIIDRIDNERHQ